MKTAIELINLGKNYSRTFGIGDVSELAESLKEHGQLMPVIVDSSNNLLAGFRRLAAAKLIGWEFIETSEYRGANPAAVNLIENLGRKDLTLWEEIQGVKDVYPNESTAEICRQLSKSNTWVRPRVAVWSMPEDFVTRVRMGQAGINDIRRMMRPKAKDTAGSQLSGIPSQKDLRSAVTRLMDAGRDIEARALSYACGGLSLDELLDD